MADETIPPRRPKKIRRVQIGFNVLAQIILILFLAAMVNSIAFKHYQRWDFSHDQKYALSDKTKRFLRTIKSKMRIIVFFSSSTPITADVQNLLTEYQYAAKGKIDVEYIDPERNLSRAKELFDKYKVVSDESLLVIDYEGRSKTVKASEMAEVDQSGMAIGEGPRVTAFKGEQAITSAMMDLVEGKKNTLGYVLGHKEPPLSENSTISVLKTFIENENIKFRELNLFDVDAVPADLKTILIIGPQYDFSDREMKLLRDFWDKQGRILLLLDPGRKTSKLNAFLNELGVKVNDDRLMAFLRTGIQEMAGFQCYVRGVDPSALENVMLTGINIPVRIGGVTVMPGDLVVGDREGVYFVPPQFVQEVLDKADVTHIHDEWTKKKFDEGKYKSSEIYGSPSDPKLQEEYKEYLKKRLDEIHKQRNSN